MITDQKKIDRVRYLLEGPMTKTKQNIASRLKHRSYEDIVILLAAFECSIDVLVDRIYDYCTGKQGIRLHIG